MKFVATIGTFDGVHCGHQKILNKVISFSQQNSISSLLVTFTPHPREVLHQKPPKKILLNNMKFKIIKNFGIDLIENIKFTKEISKLSAIEFFKEIVLKKYNIQHLVIGFNHHIGHNRSTNAEKLYKEINKLGISVEIVKPKIINGEIISSTSIRKLIEEGEIEKVTSFLSRPYKIVGTRINGAGRGKLIGFPTINVLPDNHLVRMKEGVYIVEIIKKKKIPALAFVGNSPTFNEGFRIELHIPDRLNFTFSQKINFNTILWLRKNIKFDSINELKFAIKKDIKIFKKFYKI